MSDARPAVAFDAIVLAGGGGARLGGISKADVTVGGVSMLDRVLGAVSGAEHVVVVGPPRLARPGVVTVLEDPPSGGPAAGVGAGLAALRTQGADADLVLVLACDLPAVTPAVQDLLAALVADRTADGACLTDPEGRLQTLASVFRTASLQAAVAAMDGQGGLHGASVRRLLAPLRLVGVDDPAGRGRDADTWDAVMSHRRSIGGTMGNDAAPTDALHRWLEAVALDLGIDAGAVDVDAVLDLSREVAHGVERPAVPLTSLLVGLAVAARGGDQASFDAVVSRVTELAKAWDGTTA